tara:strand:+ start:241 stop:561 length:321 start_codon:yes stop_codon:yes gene_type:complete
MSNKQTKGNKMKRTTQYDHEDYHAIATDPRGIVQSHHISKDKALELVAQGYMMSPDRKHFAGRENGEPRYNRLAKVVTMPFDQWESMFKLSMPTRWDYHKGEWAQA